jgi:hypothetical protein
VRKPTSSTRRCHCPHPSPVSLPRAHHALCASLPPSPSCSLRRRRVPSCPLRVVAELYVAPPSACCKDLRRRRAPLMRVRLCSAHCCHAQPCVVAVPKGKLSSHGASGRGHPFIRPGANHSKMTKHLKRHVAGMLMGCTKRALQKPLYGHSLWPVCRFGLITSVR